MNDGRSGSARRKAGRRGGQATRAKYGAAHYREIGARGGRVTMTRHADEYHVLRVRGGQATKRRYGAAHYRALARRSAAARQAVTAGRDAVIGKLLDDGWKIPTIIKLTLDDVPRLRKYLSRGLQDYLDNERPATASPQLFVSKTGRPLTLANTYNVMRRRKAGG